MSKKHKSLKLRLRKNLGGWMFLLPWFTLFVIFSAYPFVYGIAISFYDHNYKEMSFIGLENYARIFQDDLFKIAVSATLKMASLIIVGTCAFLTAFVLQGWTRKTQALGKLAFYLPSIVSQVALVIVWKWIFNPAFGISASVASMLGIPPINWFGDVSLAIPLIAILVMSFNVSQPIIIFSAAINGIPEDLYEASEIDGATRGKQFWRITLPLLRPTLAFVTVTTTIASLQVFVVPYMLTGGGPQYGTTSILLLVYRNAFEYSRYGYASALGVVLFLIISIIAAIQFRLNQRDIQY